MPKPDDFRWFKDNFHSQINAAIANSPFSLDMLAAIAAQETGHIWSSLRNKVSVNVILENCVGDTLDADKGRRAFPRTKAELVAEPNGETMFQIAHEALVSMAAHIPSFAGVARRADKFCHGYGVFQYDLQFFRTDPDYFLQKRWRNFDDSLAKCIGELRAAMRRIGLQNQQTLTDEEKVHVCIAYNAGTFKPAKGLKQGHFDGTQFYGEKILDFLRVSQTVGTNAVPAVIAAPAAGAAALRPPTPVATTGVTFEVNVETSPLRLRSAPKKDSNGANVIAHLPDGHRVRFIAEAAGGFLEVETSLNGAHLHGFASGKFLVKIADDAEIPVIVPQPTPPATGVVAVFAPNRSNRPVKRTEPATALSLNEPNQPGRKGTAPAVLREEIAAIIDYLASDKPSHARYQKREGRTFCNIYAHDFCTLAGVFLPRVWWKPAALVQLAQGRQVEPRLGATIDEQRANDLFRWLQGFGPQFGWRQTGTLSKLQTEANLGAIGIIVARRTDDGRPGHITIVVPETEDATAKRDATSGEVTAPLQSQAGGANFRRSTGPANWWKGVSFAESAFWIHA